MPKRYKYYNHNPNNFKIKDCVCRAISVATGLRYDAVDNLLELTADEYDCDKLCACCYSILLEEVLCYKVVECDFNKTVEQIASENPQCKILIRADAHLTVSMYGNILDIWDCSKELVDRYWIVL